MVPRPRAGHADVMTQTHEQRPSGWGAPGGDRWSRRPRRSTTDRKIAGVAGGLGRAIGVDPVLVRVGFVILTIFGGFGALLYVLGWLLLPGRRRRGLGRRIADRAGALVRATGRLPSGWRSSR